MPRRPQVADIDAYIASADSQAQPILNTLQHLIHQEIPEAEEKILYNMPFFLVNGKKIGIAAYKAHVSFQISDDLSADLLA